MNETIQAGQWSGAAEGWARWAARAGDFLLPATEKMLDLAAVAVGSRVLDAGCGSGKQTIVAARRPWRFNFMVHPIPLWLASCMLTPWSMSLPS